MVAGSEQCLLRETDNFYAKAVRKEFQDNFLEYIYSKQIFVVFAQMFYLRGS